MALALASGFGPWIAFYAPPRTTAASQLTIFNAIALLQPLGKKGEWVSSAHALQMTHPKLQKQPDQPNIGGWMTGPKGSYFKDIDTYKNITRGGGGGEGNLGLEFNILTNEYDPRARSR